MNIDLMFSSETDQWATPADFFKKVNAVFKFELDVCADHENAKCERYYSVIEDGLSQCWGGCAG
jgi:site-specific DNA-methyltransferase (adenine-specific)